LTLCKQGIEWRDAGGEAFPDFGVRTESERSAASGVWVHAISPFLRLSYFAHLVWCCQELLGAQSVHSWDSLRLVI
jgi:hypothetical protein